MRKLDSKHAPHAHRAGPDRHEEEHEDALGQDDPREDHLDAAARRERPQDEGGHDAQRAAYRGEQERLSLRFGAPIAWSP